MGGYIGSKSSVTQIDGYTKAEADQAIADAAFDPNTLATVATTGSYTDLSNVPANIVVDASYVHTDNNYTTTEKNKLAGIEAGATADQTASEILTAIKTIDGAGSGLDADTLDGQHGSYYYPASNPNGYTTNTGTVTSVATGGGLTGGTITGSGTISHADTSAQASVNNSGSVYIQDITLDTYGHVTGITSTTVPASAPTSAQVGTATAGLSAGAVGTYAWARGTGGFTISFGSTYAGSSLTSSGVLDDNAGGSNGGGNNYQDRSGSTLSGTWRCMGNGTYDGYYHSNVFLRIS